MPKKSTSPENSNPSDLVPDWQGNDDHPLAHIPVRTRIDYVLYLLRRRRLTPVEGWSVKDLAELCGCSERAIEKCQARALLKLRRKLPADIISELNPNK